MDFTEYLESAEQASRLVENEAYDEAHEILQTLIRSDISDLDKAIMCCNRALIFERTGQDRDALTWYDRGMRYEWQHRRSFAAEQKAGYLARQGRVAESLRLFESLLRRTSLMEEEKFRIRNYVDQLRG